MKYPFKPKWIPPLALGAGILGALLRLWLFTGGIDEKGLIRQDHPANALVFVLTAVVLLGLYLCLRPLTGTPTYKRLFPRSVPAAVGCVVAAPGILVTDFYELSLQHDNIATISFILGILAAVCLVLLGLCRLRGVRPKVYLHGCIAVYLMVHLISQYRAWSAEPQLQEYVFQLLASVFLMLSTYHRATLDARSGSRRWYLFFNYGALFFCFLALQNGMQPFYLSMALWAGLCDCSLNPAHAANSMRLPKNVLYCLRTLEDKGHSTYVVGGCVRDTLLGLTPHDYDLCTSATPEQMVRVFSQHPLVRSGEKHGTIGVVLDSEVYEITTFRTEGGYSDSRHPDWVNFVTSVEEDLARRDFTVNAMAYSPTNGIIDPYGGQADLKNRILRTVGDPSERFREDALRILRGVRFAARYQLIPETNTEKAMLEMTSLMDFLAPERVFSELCKLLPHVTAQDLVRYAPVILRIIPELVPTAGFDQHSPHHAYDVYTHTAFTVEATPPLLPLRLAALLHDVAKPAVFSQDEDGRGHFYSHAKVGAQTANDILLRLRASNALRNQVVQLIELHMTPLEPDKALLRRRLGKYGEDTVMQLLALQQADFSAKGTDEGDDGRFEQVKLLLDEILQEGACLTVKDLAINGNDLLSLGVEPGKIVGECMTFLLTLVQDELIPNTKEDLLKTAKQFFKNNREETL